jgi:Xaa-Pro aminopeptidase
MNSYQQRIEHLKAEMQRQEVKAMLITPGAGMRYLTGFSEEGYERLLALVIPAGDQAPLFVAPSLHDEQVRNNPAGITEITLWEDAQSWQPSMAEVIKGWGNTGTVGVDDGMAARFTLPLAEMLPGFDLKLAGPLLTTLRATKDAEELAAMQRAADATDALLPSVYAACRVGITEAEIAQVIHNGIARQGHEASFSPIVGAGSNGAFPHHHTGTTPLHSGDVIVLDLGVKVDGYCGDITRTVALGAATDEARRVYEIVYQAHQAGVDAVRPGATGHEVDAAARQVIEKAGYGEYFVHRTGHGIGLDDHEPPYIVSGNRVPLRPSECFSIEPGIYLPGKFGLRLENIVSMAEDGTARVFNEAIPPELMIL